MIGRPVLRAEESLSEAVDLKDIMCGDEAAKARQYLDIKYPVSSVLIIIHVSLVLTFNFYCF
jgi:actin-related protein 2